MRPAVFIDRDDTLIEDMAYSADPDRIRLKPGAARALARLHDAGYAVVVVTNQSGVARGYFTEEQLAIAHRRMKELLKVDSAHIDAIYYCPYLPGPEAVIETYRQDSELRKPKPGMLIRAARELALDLPSSWMVGDAARDVEAGRAASCRTILVGDAGATRGPAADFMVPTLPDAVDLILSNGHALDPAAADLPSPVTPSDSSAPAAQSATADPALARAIRELSEDFQRWMQESRRSDVGPGHLIGAMAQTFAAALLAWGLYAIFDNDRATQGGAVIRLLAAIVFQLIALTYLTRRR